MQSVEGKVAVVTGAASGIGLGMARAFTGAGMRVVLADVREDALEETVDALRGDGHDVIGVPTDVSKLAEVEALAAAALDAFGAVHVLCNNAGVGLFSPIAKTLDRRLGMGAVDRPLGSDLRNQDLPADHRATDRRSHQLDVLPRGARRWRDRWSLQRREAWRRGADGDVGTRAAGGQVTRPDLGPLPGRGEHRHQREQPREPPGSARCRSNPHPRRRQGRRPAAGRARPRHASG